ncbi:MAG: alpha/beta hydrolase [Planctomycetia bacterium]|nr:alpha/beta hydrolase [Planctomycetia bacterium]
MPIHHVTLRDTRLAVHSAGSGLPLLLLHAFPLDHSMWDLQAPLADHLRIIAPDLRGFGASDGAGPESIAQMADDAVALLDSLHVTRPAVVCGVSMGGYVAQHVAARHPDRVASLVLVDTRLEADTPEARAVRVDLAAKVGRLGLSILADAMIPRLLAPMPANADTMTVARHRDNEAALRRMIVEQRVGTIQAALAALGDRPDMTDTMRHVRMPTLLVVGADDLLTPPECLAAAEEIIPDARLLIVPRAGHLTPLEAPEVFNAALLEFLGEKIRG